MTKNKLLLFSSILSFSLAIFQAVISFVPSWSLYFGAPEEIVQKPVMLIITGLIAAVFFFIFGLYAYSGAGKMKPLPFLRIALLVISVVFIFRGLMVIPVILQQNVIIYFIDKIDPAEPFSSLVSLLIGIFYITGTITGWQQLKKY